MSGADEPNGKRPRKGTPSRKRDGYLPDIHRSLPQSLDAEKGVLCSCLLSPGNVLDEAATLDPKVFHHPAHRLIFEELCAMRAELVPVDFITLTERLKNKGVPDDATDDQRKEHHGVLDRAGGAAAISELFTFVPTAGNADYYMDIIREKLLLRQLIQLCTEYAARGYDEQGDAKDLLDEFEQAAFALGAHEQGESDIFDTAEVMRRMVEQAEVRYKRRGGGQCVGVPSGFVDLDRMLSGFMDEELYLLAARPSQGKSAAAVNMLRHIIEHPSGYKGGLFSLEMPAADQANRLIADAEGVELQKFRDGFFSEGDLNVISRAAARYGRDKRLFIDQTPALSVQSFRVKARRMVQRGVNILFIDYLQLMRSTSKRAQDNRQAEVAEISASLKGAARELKIPIVALAQLTRDAENREPNLSMLRESGALEQDADAVIFVYRPEKGELDETTGDPIEVEQAKFIVAKQRNGPVGPIPLTFTGKFARFESTTKAAYSNNKKKRQQGFKKGSKPTDAHPEPDDE